MKTAIFFNFLTTSLAFFFKIGHAVRASTNINAAGEPISEMAGLYLPPLPYAYNALEPYISEKTLQFHHDKHHAKYVETAQALLAGTDLEHAPIERIVRRSHGTNIVLFNNVAQSFNHQFYWSSMAPGGGGVPTGRLAELINTAFGSFEKFREEFYAAGMTAFGSGWAWLVLDQASGTLKVVKTIGADTPLVTPGLVPLLTMDVWEHAYYLDYQNLRASYIDNFLNHLVSWSAVASRLPPPASA